MEVGSEPDRDGISTVGDIIQTIETLSGHELNCDEGVQHGSSDAEVHGVSVCWMPTPTAIEAAGAVGDELLIGHESLYFPYDVRNRQLRLQIRTGIRRGHDRDKPRTE